MLTAFGRFLSTPKKNLKHQKTPDKATEKPHQTTNPADTPALRGAAFFRCGAKFSRVLPAPGRAGHAGPPAWVSPGRDRVSMAAAAAEAPGVSLPLLGGRGGSVAARAGLTSPVEAPPAGREGKLKRNGEMIGGNLCCSPQRITQTQGMACERG